MSVKYRPDEYSSASVSFGRSGSPTWPRTSISATDHCRPFGSATTCRSRYRQSSMLHEGTVSGIRLGFRFRWRQQLVERTRDLSARERLRNEQDVFRLTRAQARVGLLRRIADDHDRQVGKRRIAADDVEERLAHLVDRAVEDERIGALVGEMLVDRGREAGGNHAIAAVAQRERQQLGNLGGVVDEEDPPRQSLRGGGGRVHFVLPEPVFGRRFFFVSDGSRSSTHTRPPAT